MNDNSGLLANGWPVEWSTFIGVYRDKADCMFLLGKGLLAIMLVSLFIGFIVMVFIMIGDLINSLKINSINRCSCGVHLLVNFRRCCYYYWFLILFFGYFGLKILLTMAIYICKDFILIITSFIMVFIINYLCFNEITNISGKNGVFLRYRFISNFQQMSFLLLGFYSFIKVWIFMVKYGINGANFY